MINAVVIITVTIVENLTYVVVNNASVSFSIIYQRNGVLNIDGRLGRRVAQSCAG